MRTLYVGMGLTQAPKEFREAFQDELKEAIRATGLYEVLDFIGLQAGTDSLVYTEDKRKAESADLCLFIVDHPSIGLGMEIAFRLATKKPMLVCAHREAHITRMLTGMCELEQVPFLRYESIDDIVKALV